ncbi:Hsp20/alpha crystallin family protein [Chitinophaga rhizosphaerae]|uniref:Hsp20/alpha crystallin family protein n=1 Tax=Chitinophaga rhizosphaerae TaxID=1864947 RepID=UPI000F80BEA1|nr:Hsp20/alpha crystallin family protein [Chitinophaga rhizosphaerae]
MSVIKRNRDAFPTFTNLFDDLFNRELYNWGHSNFSSSGTTIPAVNIRETPDNFEVEVAAPGMDKNDFKIQLDGNTLSISSEKVNRNNEDYSRKEFSYQAFQRTLMLPKDVVDESGITARYDNGLLRLTIPKREEVKQKPPRMINID